MDQNQNGSQQYSKRMYVESLRRKLQSVKSSSASCLRCSPRRRSQTKKNSIWTKRKNSVWDHQKALNSSPNRGSSCLRCPSSFLSESREPKECAHLPKMYTGPRKKGFSCSAQLLCSTCATLLALLFVFSHCHEHTYRNRNNFSASCLNGIHGHTLNLHLSTPY